MVSSGSPHPSQASSTVQIVRFGGFELDSGRESCENAASRFGCLISRFRFCSCSWNIPAKSSRAKSCDSGSGPPTRSSTSICPSTARCGSCAKRWGTQRTTRPSSRRCRGAATGLSRRSSVRLPGTASRQHRRVRAFTASKSGSPLMGSGGPISAGRWGAGSPKWLGWVRGRRGAAHSVHRGVAARELDGRSHPRVLRRRHDRCADHRAGAGSECPGHLAELVITVQGDAEAAARHRAGTERRVGLFKAPRR